MAHTRMVAERPRRARIVRAALTIVCACLLGTGMVNADSPVVHHELSVTVQPQQGRLQAEDRVTLAEPRRNVSFHLDPGLTIEQASPGRLTPKTGAQGHYRLTFDRPQQQFTLRYGGRPQAADALKPDAVSLGADMPWYPTLEGVRMRFTLEVHLPEGWLSVSQGENQSRGKVARWHESNAQQGIYLIAARFTRYARSTDRGLAEAYLRSADPRLAQTYLDATERYLEFYSRLLTPYPYTKFALVENHWDSGWGMPSFTLLGPRVIRLPFIPYTSFPHEIVHNWWGNGVYVRWDKGNWSEGLTTYLADHLNAEQRGRGALYRRGALQKYADYVHTHRESSLQDFRARHDQASQAIGYSKGMMLFHMLRRALGDGDFLQGLRRFYESHQFQHAGYEDLHSAFEQVSGKNLKTFFAQWTLRSGAPRLSMEPGEARAVDGGYELPLTLSQKTDGAAYRLRVPVAVTLEDTPSAEVHTLDLQSPRQDFRLTLPKRPLRVEVDPDFDVFRRLHAEEIPPSLGQMLASERILFVLPAKAPAALRTGYRRLAQRLAAAAGAQAELVDDDALEALPNDRAVWLLGWRQRWLAEAAAQAQQPALAVDAQQASLERQRFASDQHAVVLALHPRSDLPPRVWLAADRSEALTALARKLPHYSNASALVFEYPSFKRVYREQWPTVDSPLSAALVHPAPAPAPRPERPPLAAPSRQ